MESHRPDIAPGPEHSHLPASYDTDYFSVEQHPGARPEILTPSLRADMFHNRYFAAMSYVPLGFLATLWVRGDSRYATYHARQGFTIFLLQFIFSLATSLPYIGLILFIASLFLSILGFVGAVRANEYLRFPLVGGVAEKLLFL